MARKENPNLDIPLSEQEIWLVRMIISAIVGSFLIIAINYMQIPESVPIHFNGAGKPDAWGPKAMLWILPVIMGLVIFLLLRVSRKPAKLNFPYEVPAEKAPHIYQSQAFTTPDGACNCFDDALHQLEKYSDCIRRNLWIG